MGRHSAPASEGRDPRRPLFLAVTVAVVVLAFGVVALSLALRGGDDDGTTTANPGTTRRTTTALPSSAALPSVSLTPSASPSESASAAATTSAPPTSSAPATSTKPATSAKPKRPPTLRLEWLGTSYVRVRVAGDRTVFEKIEGKGTVRTFDQHTVTALIGNAAQIRATVNGKTRKPGASGQIATIVARR